MLYNKKQEGADIMSKRNRINARWLFGGGAGEVDAEGRPLRGRGQRSPVKGGKKVGTMDSPLMVNLTKHLSDEVIIDEDYNGRNFTIEDMHPADREYLLKLHDFNGKMPRMEVIRKRAEAMADLAVRYGVKYAWVGGSGYLMPFLDEFLRRRGITPVFSWSRRDYATVLAGGQKTLEMYRRHSGWIVMEADGEECGLELEDDESGIGSEDSSCGEISGGEDDEDDGE